MDKKSESFLFIADLHAVIKVSDPDRLEELSNAIAMAWLASGLDPDTTNFYRQSDVPEITELAWLLSCITEKGLLNRALFKRPFSVIQLSSQASSVISGTSD